MKNIFRKRLTNNQVSVKFRFMAKIYDQLRKAIKASDKTRYRLWRETGIDQALLVRFMAGKSGLSIESIEKIADSLNLDIIIKPKSKMRKVTR